MKPFAMCAWYQKCPIAKNCSVAPEFSFEARDQFQSWGMFRGTKKCPFFGREELDVEPVTRVERDFDQ